MGELHNVSLGAASAGPFTITAVVVGEYRRGKIEKTAARIQDG